MGHDEQSRADQPVLRDVVPLQPFRAVHDDDVVDSLDPDAARQALRRLHALDRRLGDQKLRDALAAEQFTGPRYQRFAEELAAYGIAVLSGWMYSGYIFELTARRGFPLHPSGRELEELVRDCQAREELANMTVALTLPSFRRQALVDGNWRLDGGASLTTYFMGATLYVFPNQFRQHRAYHRRYAQASHAEAAVLPAASNPFGDPAAIVTGDLQVRAALAGLPKQTAAVVVLDMGGYSHQEIAEMLGLGSTRQVEGILYRWRTKVKSHRTDRRGDDGA